MSFNGYEGKMIGTYRNYIVTESIVRPVPSRFEAYLREHDGEASLFGTTIEDLQAEIDEQDADEQFEA